MKIAEPASDSLAALEPSSRVSRFQRISAFVVFAGLLCSGATSCTKTQVGLSVAAGAAIVAGTTVAVTLAVQNHRHTLQGCLFSGTNGLELRTSDSKIYALEGSAAPLKIGDRVKLHGSKLKQAKDSTSDQVFVVEKLSKDYGSCPANVAANATTPR